MLETPHAVVGGAVGALCGSPQLALPVAITSHFLTDFMPHWNVKFPPKGTWSYIIPTVDFIVAIAITAFLWLYFPERPEVAVGAVGAMLPDLVLGIRFIFKARWLRAYEWFHDRISTEVGPLVGLPPQTILTVAAAYYLTTL